MANGLGLKRGQMIKCPECKTFYDLSKVTHQAINGNKRNLYCSNCGHRVGKVQ